MVWQLYGFKPYNSERRQESKELIEAYNINNSIIAEYKTINLNMENIIQKAIKKENFKNIDISAVIELANRYTLLREFIYRLLDEFDKYCCVILHILKTIYGAPQRTGLTDLLVKVFI